MVSAMSPRSRCPSFGWSRKNCRSCASAGARAGRITVSAWMIASRCAREKFIALPGAHTRGDLLHGEAVLGDRIPHLHRHVVLVHAEPYVHLALVLWIDVPQVHGLHAAQG